MEVPFLIKVFNVEFSLDLHVFKFLEFLKIKCFLKIDHCVGGGTKVIELSDLLGKKKGRKKKRINN